MSMRIPIGKNRYLVSDEFNYWIVQECKSAKTDGYYDKRLSGYCTTLAYALDSYIDRQIRTEDIESLKELDRKIEKLKREIRKWIKDDLEGLKDADNQS